MTIHERLTLLDDVEMRRLVEIASEHVKLVRRYIFDDLTWDEKQAILKRIDELRAQRAAILEGAEE